MEHSTQTVAYTGGIDVGPDVHPDLDLESGVTYPVAIELDEPEVKDPNALVLQLPGANLFAYTQDDDLSLLPVMVEQQFLFDGPVRAEQDLAPRELTSAALADHDQLAQAAVMKVQDRLPNTLAEQQTAHAGGGADCHQDHNMGRRAGNILASPAFASSSSTKEPGGETN